VHQRASIARAGATGGELAASVTRIVPRYGASSVSAPRQAETPPHHADVFLTFDKPQAQLPFGEEVTVRFEPCGS
jgi:hypothetical protein